MRNCAKIRAVNPPGGTGVLRSNNIRNILTGVKEKSNWTEYIPLVRRIINSSIHSATGFRPSEMVFGDAINLDKGLVPVGGIGNDHIILRRNEEIIKLAEKSQKELDAKNRS